MPYNELLAERIKINLELKNIFFIEKKMFGGLTFMIDDKMCIGIVGDKLMARIDPEIYQSSLEKTGVTKMIFTNKEMIGYIYISEESYSNDSELEYWINLCLEYNPKAKSSKTKKR